ncbi:KAP family P-loop NTPase fold protein [Tardiphaga sp. 866_E4_N2_1]|uniref:KAP family P-loop NTPase fold protein n=1 Tax=unclassified Tardiphaga TaxID=2631404 RepID=UPI003F236286
MLSSDRPIASEDDDVLGFSQFADALARSLTEMAPDEGIVVSIEGAWGAGKTSALRLIERRIIIRELARESGIAVADLVEREWSAVEVEWEAFHGKRKTHLIRFNPWNFSGQENLVRAFFGEVGAAIGHSENGAISNAIKKLTAYLPSVGVVAGGAGALAAGGVAAFGVGSAAGRAVGEGIQSFASKTSSLESLKRDLAVALRESAKRIIIVIDDVDRLMPSEMRSIFSLVKSLGDLPNILYVLSFDRSVVTQAMGAGVDRVDPDFLEKIIQVQVKLPPPWQAEIRDLFFQRLNSVIGDTEPNDFERWQMAFFQAVQPYIQTPRDVSRIYNAMQIIWPNVAGDVDLTDLVILTSLQLFEPGEYEKIFENIEELSGENWTFKEEKEFSSGFEPRNAKNPQAAKKALAYLFPALAKGWNEHIGDIPYLKKREHRRICTKQYYRNYFLFGRDPSRQSKADIEALLSAVDVSERLPIFLRELAQRKVGKRNPPVANFLEQVFETVHVKPLLSEETLRTFLDVSDELIQREDRVWEFFVEDNLQRLESIAVHGLTPLSAAERLKRLSILQAHPRGITLASNAVIRLAGQHGLYGGEATYGDDCYMGREEAINAAEMIATKISSIAENGQLLQLIRPVRLIFIWRSIAGVKPVREWLMKEIAVDDSVLRLAQVLASTSYRTVGTTRSEVRIFNAKTFSELIDVTHFKERLSSAAQNAGSDESRRIQSEFLKAELRGSED